MFAYAPPGQIGGWLMSALGLERQRRVWSKRAVSWDHGSVTGLDRVIDTVIDHARPTPTDVAVDLGCGTGQVTFPLAKLVNRVIAVDISPAMIELLQSNARDKGLGNVDARVAPIEKLHLDPGSVDLVVSNYSLHHLADRDKAVLVEHAATWLRPGGRLVIGDMMFGRGGDARDWNIAASKMSALARRGPGGWWRIAKNLWRYLWRVQERPIAMSRWESILRSQGLVGIVGVPVVAEAAVVAGTKPAAE